MIKVIKKEVDIEYLSVSVIPRYWEELDDNGSFPMKYDEYWRINIEVDTGKILDWPKGETASIYFKVCDCCWVDVVDADGITILEYNGYVPNILCPKEPGFGDYVIMDINSEGIIQKWNVDEIDDLFECPNLLE